ncbi:hypothetical protein ncot_10155 [Nocardioides sp. JQ2195]|uniref:DUF6891 domain-containing protein n=1 Tax=Nocardioides sp. JQ2195 TaxID=2592334 RepID=UPI00143E7B6F|nr:hypothetical protein [Nocardioides sp. JQ2195]QIX26925.1 hypothetical protein ncot_10155 [Nocardioides sp. JQ2195]
MVIRGARRTPEEELVDFARLQVRAGLLSPEQMEAEVVEATRAEMPETDASIMARAWLAGARKDLAAEASTWPATTDHDRLQAVFAECSEHGVRVLQGVEDHWKAKESLASDASDGLRGVIWFTQPDVWHAIDEGMLEVNLWHASTANAAPGDHLLEAVLSCFSRHGLSARFDEGRIEVSAFWHRRP